MTSIHWRGFDNRIFVSAIHIISLHTNRRLLNIGTATLAPLMLHILAYYIAVPKLSWHMEKKTGGGATWSQSCPYVCVQSEGNRLFFGFK